MDLQVVGPRGIDGAQSLPKCVRRSGTKLSSLDVSLLPLYPGNMATVQVVEEGRFVVFGWPKEGGGSERLRAQVMRGAIRGHAQLALQALQVPALRSRLVREVRVEVPRFYSQGGLKLPNTGEHRRYLRLTVAGRQPIWLRFDNIVRQDLVKALQEVVARPEAESDPEEVKPRRVSPGPKKGRKPMSKAVKQPGGFDAKAGPKSPRGTSTNKIPGSRPPKKTEMSRGWDGKKG